MTISIPDRWLQGRSFIHRQNGLSYRDAIHASVKEWIEQMRLEEEFTKEMMK